MSSKPSSERELAQDITKLFSSLTKQCVKAEYCTFDEYRSVLDKITTLIDEASSKFTDYISLKATASGGTGIGFSLIGGGLGGRGGAITGHVSARETKEEKETTQAKSGRERGG